MAKYYGMIGYVRTAKTAPGVHEEISTERPYRGDVIRENRKWERGDGINDNLVISNSISILADAYAMQHLGEIRYATWYGVKWKVSNIEVKHPRLILSLGGLYNGNET